MNTRPYTAAVAALGNQGTRPWPTGAAPVNNNRYQPRTTTGREATR